MKYDLIICDVDGTLVDAFSDKLLPQATKFFRSLVQSGVEVALATNQGGVGLRYWMETDFFGEPDKYPTKKVAEDRILRIAEEVSYLYQYPRVFVSWCYQSRRTGVWGPVPKDDDDNGWLHIWRKPMPGMLVAAMELAQGTPDRTLMIGNGPEDFKAALAVGCDFASSVDIMRKWGLLPTEEDG